MKKIKAVYLSLVAVVCSLGLVLSSSAISFGLHQKNAGENYKIIETDKDASTFLEELEGNEKTLDSEEDANEDSNKNTSTQKSVRYAVSLNAVSGDSSKTIMITAVKWGVGQTLTIPSTLQGCAVTSINSLAFAGNTTLKKLIIPASVISIKQGALSGQNALDEIVVNSENPVFASINGNLCKKNGELVLYAGGKTSGTTYNVPAGTPSIMADTFTGSNITSLTSAGDAIMTYYFNSDYSDTANTGAISSANFGKTIYLKWQLNQPAVTANATTKTISWSAVPHATSYLVQKGASTSSLSDYTTTSATSVDLSTLATDTYYFSVTAKADGFTTSAASAAVEYVAKPANITLTFDISGYGGESYSDWGITKVLQNGSEINSIVVEGGLTLKEILSKYNLTLKSVTGADITASNFDSIFTAKHWNKGANLNIVFNESTQIVFNYTYYSCFTADTDVLCYDEKKKKFYKKKIKDITYSDLVACWDFDNGKLTYSKVIWIRKPESKQCLIRELTFTGGTKLTIVDEHMMFAANKGKFVTDFEVGDQFMNEKGEYITLTKIEDSYRTEVPYAIATNYHINCFTGGVVGSLGYNNLYPIKDRKFVKDDRKIVPFEELNVPREYYDGFRLGEVANRTPERINSSINNYFVKNVLKK